MRRAQRHREHGNVQRSLLPIGRTNRYEGLTLVFYIYLAFKWRGYYSGKAGFAVSECKVPGQ